MLIYTRNTDPRLGDLPPPVRMVVLDQLRTLQATAGRDPVPEDDGCVVLLQPHDTPQVAGRIVGHDLGATLEGTFRSGPCLVGVVLLGNSGAAISVVCPDDATAPPALRALLLEHLTDPKEGNHARHQHHPTG
jgi:hypothetical protein